MLRELRIEEALIDELERGKTLQESAYQGLVKWKRRFGREATLKQLDDCLRKIGLTSVAEQINGYSTI
ncbi:hypothetical protein DPMN_103845 [Dreissena polymorpha]|uniref:Death domain-containing protein n=1 Tax=Dreissena polymorpha TaxID=45954 RepID=A0A9D4JZJ2_DREPO|nr:hypothetical protein DPMN_103845 [Dreissena polymorpha]